MNAICYRTHPKIKNYPVQYVSHLPSKKVGCADFGYTHNPKGTICRGVLCDAALPLSPYWQTRFAKACRDVGMTYHAIPCKP